MKDTWPDIAVQPIPGEQLPLNVRGAGDLRYRTPENWVAAGRRGPGDYCHRCHSDPGFVYRDGREEEGLRRIAAGFPVVIALEAFSCPHGHVLNAERLEIIGRDNWARKNRRRYVWTGIYFALILLFTAAGLIPLALLTLGWLFAAAWQWRNRTNKIDPNYVTLMADLNLHPEYPGIYMSNNRRRGWKGWLAERYYRNFHSQPWLHAQG